MADIFKANAKVVSSKVETTKITKSSFVPAKQLWSQKLPSIYYLKKHCLWNYNIGLYLLTIYILVFFPENNQTWWQSNGSDRQGMTTLMLLTVNVFVNWNRY